MNHPSGLGVVTIGRDLSVQSWNQWLADVTGMSEADVTGRPLLSLVPSDRADLIRDVLDDVLSTGASRVLAPAFHGYLIACPVRQPSPHFTEMRQLVTFAPLDDKGRIAGAMITIEDVTPRLDRERALTMQIDAGSVRPADAIAAVGAADWRLRGAAVRTLRQRASTEEIAHLLGALKRGYTDFNVVSSALQVLAAANRDVTSPLVELLSDPQPDLRMHAALALGQAGDRTAIPSLVRALDDDDTNVRFHVIEALGLLGAGDAVEPLARIAQSEDFFLAFPAIDALAKADDPRVAPALTSLLENPLLRPAVIQTLAASGDEDAVAPLAAILDADAESVTDVAAALVRIRDRYEDAFSAGTHIVELTRDALTRRGVARLSDAVTAKRAPLGPLVTVLGWNGSAGLDAMIDVLGDPAVDAIAAEAIAAVGRGAVEPLVARLASGERAARLSAAALLGALGDRRAVAPLIKTLDGADAELTAAAATALARLGDAAALDALLPLFAHPQAIVRQAALAAVNSIGADATSARIAPRLTDPDSHVRASAIRVAGYFGFEELNHAVFRALDDEDEEVRRAALEQLPVMEDKRAVARLAQAVGSETPRNRAAAAHALRSVESGFGSALVEALEDEDVWVRYFAATSVARRRDAGAAPALARLAENDSAPHVRIAAIEALTAVAPDTAAAISRRLARDPDRDVAAGALAALAAVGTPDADALLEEAIRSSDMALRRGAVQAFAHRATDRAVEMLSWAARADEPADLSRLAIDSLVQLAGASRRATQHAALDALVELATVPATRAAAIGRLAALPDSVDHLAGWLSSPREATRIAVAEALARMRNRRASDALVAALHDPSAAVRSAAVAGFGRLGTSVAADAIADLSTADPDGGVRRLAAAICRRHRWGATQEGRRR